MNEFSTDGGKRQFSGAASLAVLGLHLQQLDLFGPVRQVVKIAQKTVKHAPLDKLYEYLSFAQSNDYVRWPKQDLKGECQVPGQRCGLVQQDLHVVTMPVTLDTR